jgi:hypothetical protein
MKYSVFVVLLIFISCSSSGSADDNVENHSETTRITCDNYISTDRKNLIGLIFIDSKQNILFDYDSSGWRQKIYLQPCGEKVRTYVNRSYDDFLNLRSNTDCALSVSVSGWFLKKHDGGASRDIFLFDSVSILE